MAKIDKLPKPDSEKLPAGDWELRGRYEVRSADQLLLMLDTMNTEYAAEWFTDKDLNGFLDVVSQEITIYENTSSFCMLSPKEGYDETIESAFENIYQKNEFPEWCTYLELKFDDREYSISWAEGEPKPTIVTSVEGTDTELFESVFRETVSAKDLPTRDIDFAVDEARTKIKRDLDTMP